MISSENAPGRRGYIYIMCDTQDAHKVCGAIVFDAAPLLRSNLGFTSIIFYVRCN